MCKCTLTNGLYTFVHTLRMYVHTVFIKYLCLHMYVIIYTRCEHISLRMFAFLSSWILSCFFLSIDHATLLARVSSNEIFSVTQSSRTVSLPQQATSENSSHSQVGNGPASAAKGLCVRAHVCTLYCMCISESLSSPV